MDKKGVEWGFMRRNFKVIIIILLIIIFFVLILWFSFGDANSFFRDILSLILPIASRGFSQSFSGTSPSLSIDEGVAGDSGNLPSGNDEASRGRDLDCSKLKLGDLNGDGRVSIGDLETLKIYIAGGNAKCPKNGDLNGDGKVNSLDTEIFTNAVQNSRPAPNIRESPRDDYEPLYCQNYHYYPDCVCEEDKSRVIINCESSVDRGCTSLFRYDCIVRECGNNFCEAGESSSTCPADCPASRCGNNVCDAEETVDNCPADCSTAICTSNPSGCDAGLECSIGIRCDCNNECDAGLECRNGVCNRVSESTCTNNPSGCDSTLDCSNGIACNCNQECVSGLCSNGQCISSNSPGSPTQSPTPTPTPTPTPNPTPTQSLSFSPQEQKPVFQRLFGWFVKTITGWFVSD